MSAVDGNLPLIKNVHFHLVGPCSHFFLHIYESTYQPFPTQSHLLTPLGKKPFENNVGKGEIVCNKQFFLFPQCFLPIWITFCHFYQI